MPPRSPTRRKSTWKSKQSELELSLADRSNTVPESENKGQEALSAAVKDEGGEQVAPLVIAGVEIKQELRVLDSNYADEAVMSTAGETKVKEEERIVNVNTVSFMEDGERMEGDHDKFDNAAKEEEVEGKQNEGIHVVAEQNSSEEGTAAAQIDDAEAFVDNDNFPVLNDGSDGQEGGEVGAKDEEDIGDNEEDNEDEEQPAEFVNNHITDRKKKKDFEIFIGRLDKGAVEDDLIEVFGKFGEIKAARIVRNPATNKSRGFAFIQYMTVEQAKNALFALNEGIQVRGKHIIISASQDNDTLYMGNICKLWTKERVLGTLKSYGIENIEEIYLPADPQKAGKIKGFALLEFSTHSDAMAAFQRLRKPDAVFGRDRSAKVAFAQTPMHPNQEIRSQMEDDVPHDGASPETPPQFFPEMEAEPGPVLLPPKVRRFDPTTYDPQTYVLPPESVRHFKGFERDAQDDLLLREPASHLSYGATEEDSRSIRGYGATSAREWYMELPDGVRHIVDEAGFGLFCMGLSHLIASRPLLGALVERWWDTTNSFHFSTAGEMTMTPYDFSMLTGIEVGGRPIPYDTDMGEWEAAWIYLLGAHPPLRSGMVRYSWFAEQFRGREPETPEEVEHYARGFLMFLFGTTLFADRANTVGLYLLSALVDLSQVHVYDWAGAGLATLYGYMSSTSRRSGNMVGGYWRAWELWVYAYFPALAPEPEVEMPPVVPYSHRYDGRCLRRTRKTFSFFRRYFDTVTAAEITWQPWATMPEGVGDQFARARGATRFRLLFEGPICRAWFLGERFVRQTLGLPQPIVPMGPPPSMRATEQLTSQEMIQFTRGLDADYYLGEGDYATFIETHLMPPLTDIHGGEGIRVPAMRERVGVPKATRAHGRGATQTRQRTGWPELPTALTCWRYTGEAYQIPIEPAAAGHRYTRAQDAPPAPPRYTEDLLELLASFEGMILRREALLGFYGIQVPPLSTASAAAAPGPSVPPPATGRERQAPARSRDRARSDATEPGSEAESSSGSGSGSASGSDSGTDGDNSESPPRKRTKMASRA